MKNYTRPLAIEPMISFRGTTILLAAMLGIGWLAPGGAARAAASAGETANWPQWRGPLATGVAPAANPPTTWSEASHVKWKVKIPGEGSASPIVWGNRVFIQTAIPTGRKADGTPTAASSPAPAPGRGSGGFSPNIETPAEAYQFALLCLDRETGKTLWQRTARAEVPHEGYFVGEGSLASQSPMTDGDRVYAYFGSRGLYSYDFDGNLKWQKDLGKMKIKMSFGEGSSAALSGNMIVVTWDHEGDSFVAAFNKESGAELWRQPREEATSWATPLVVEQDGQYQVVTDASKRIRSYDLASGKLLWECAGLTANVIPTPVAGGGMVYCLSGYSGHALLAIRLGRTGNLTGTGRDRLEPQQEHAVRAVAVALWQSPVFFCGQRRQDFGMRRAERARVI